MSGLVSVLERIEPAAPPPTETSAAPRGQLFDIAPYDEDITGLPHLIAQPDEALNPNSPHTSWHHPHHPEAFLLRQGEIGRAVRTSRLELARNVDHNFGVETYHHMVGGSHTPESRLGRIRVVLFNVVNAVTDKVFDTDLQDIRPITHEERQRFFRSGEIIVQSEFSVRRALTRFAIDNAIDNLKRSETRAYKDAKTAEDRARIVNEVIGRFLPISFQPINQRYTEARRFGFLPEGAPGCPAEVARQFVFSEPTRFEMFDEAFKRITELRDNNRAA